MSKKPTAPTALELPLAMYGKWTVKTATNAIAMLEAGHVASAASLSEHMSGRDWRIRAALNTRVNGVLGLPFTLEAADHPNTQAAKRAVKTLNGFWYDLMPEGSLADAMKDVLMLGMAPMQLTWSNFQPSVNFWSAAGLEFDDSLAMSLPGVTPAKIQTRDGLVPFMPDGKEWGLLTGNLKRPYLRGLIRTLFVLWLTNTFTARDWARFSEVHGAPTWVLRRPASGETAAASVVEQLKNIGSEAVIDAPYTMNADGTKEEFLIELLEAKSKTGNVFEAFLNWAGENIDIVVLGQNMTTKPTDGQVGITGAKEVRQDLKEFDATMLSTAIRNQVLKPWALYQFGDANLAPWPKWNAEPPEDKAARAVALNTIADAATKLAALGVNVKPVLESYDLEVGKPPPPPPPPTPPAPPDPNTKSNNATRARWFATNSNDGFTNGQLYADALADHASLLGLMDSEISRVLEVIAQAEDFDDLRARLLALYGTLNADEFADKIQAALTLGRLAGQYAVREDAPEVTP